MTRKRLNLLVDDGTTQRWREVAIKLDCVVSTGGTEGGKGNLSQLLVATIRPDSKVDLDKLIAAIKDVREEAAKTAPSPNNP